MVMNDGGVSSGPGRRKKYFNNAMDGLTMRINYFMLFKMDSESY